VGDVKLGGGGDGAAGIAPSPQPPPARGGGGFSTSFATAVLGIGNCDRGDDAVGRIVARLLRGRVPATVRIVEHDGEATAVLAELQGLRRVWVIDAAQSGAPPGTVHRIDCSVTDAAVPSGSVSSHGFGVAEAIGLARALGTLPPLCIVYAIEAAHFTPGAALSSAVTQSAHDVAERILAELATPLQPSSHHPPHPVPATDHR
jgi:hydrogenase maturation protease